MKDRLSYKKIKAFSILMILFFGVSIFSALAAAPSGGYSPGSTLDPDCSPGDSDCSVEFAIENIDISLTLGSLLFSDGFNTAGDNSNLFWDSVLKRLGIGTNSPSESLDVSGAIKIGTTSNTNAGTIRYVSNNFSGYNGSSWVALDTQGGSSSLMPYINNSSAAEISASSSNNVISITGASNIDTNTTITVTPDDGNITINSYTVKSGTEIDVTVSAGSSTGSYELIAKNGTTANFGSFDFNVTSATVYQNLLIVGASILSDSINASLLETEMDAAYGNSSINVINEAVSGWDTTDLRNGIATILSNNSGLSGGALVLIHIGGNNVSATKPYSTATQNEKDTIDSDIRAIVASINSAGYTPVIADLTFRNYDNTTYATEANGSSPYNDGIINSLANELTGSYTFSDNTSIMDFYNYIYRYGDYIVKSDDIHPNFEGGIALRTLIVDTLGKYNFTGVKPTKLAKTRIDKNRIYINFGRSFAVAGTSSQKVNNAYLASDNTTYTVPSTLYDDGNTATSITMAVTQTFAGSNTEGSVLTGNDAPLWDGTFRESWYLGAAGTNSTTGVITLSGLDTGTEYRLWITGSRTAADDRTTDITIQGTTKSFQARSNNSDYVEFIVTPSASDMTITVEKAASATFSYIGGLFIEENL